MDRRAFLTTGGAAAMAAQTPARAGDSASETISLNGTWRFRPGAETKWRDVEVPHTWQVSDECAEHYGQAWYSRDFDCRKEWAGGVLRLEFEAVFHSAWVTVNGKPAGEHVGKGYTAFTLDITPYVVFGKKNTVEVKVDNSFNESILPRGRSSDWAHDGGIYRPVHLHVSPKTYIERVDVDASPEAIRVKVIVRGGSAAAEIRILEEAAGTQVAGAACQVRAGENHLEPIHVANPKLWHFDHPHLYRLEAILANGHRYSTVFGIRTFAVGKDGFYLNGEKVLLVGVERMAGSHPDFGMAEPGWWIEHDHNDMKLLNCVFTRVHWPQDKRVLDYCDRHGILIQTEIPVWGSKTFEGMGSEPSEAILNNGLEQLREMIARDRNHPSLVSWGLCNEIDGQNPPAYKFARRMYEEAKKLDPGRPRSYASNSLSTTPEKDVAGLMDFIEWNEYYQSWQKGDTATLKAALERLHRTFPDKLIVISEYGYCACTPSRPEADGMRIEVLRGHNRVFRDAPYVAGLIFFCYNDYRTHMGDKGKGVLKQRVHGVVDVYGKRKPSWDELRRESSPVAALECSPREGKWAAKIVTRNHIPAYTLRGYTLRAVACGAAGIPYQLKRLPVPVLRPGETHELTFALETDSMEKVVFDLLSPTGFSVCTSERNL